MNNYEVGVPSKTKHGESEFEGGFSRGLHLHPLPSPIRYMNIHFNENKHMNKTQLLENANGM